MSDTVGRRGPGITVVVICYNEGELLRRALESLDRQEDRDFEILIVNDASPCETTNSICREWEESARNVTVVWRPKNGGLYNARNDGFRTAAGEVCACLDGDDELPPGAIGTIRRTFIENPGTPFVFGDYIRRDVEKGEEWRVDCGEFAKEDGRIDPPSLLRKWTLLGHSPCRKSVWRDVGGYRAGFGGYTDVDFWMRVLAAGYRGHHVPEVIYKWHRSAAGMNAAQKRNQLYYDARSVRYYEELGEIPRFWDRLVLRFLDRVIEPEARRLARRSLPSLIPRKRSRIIPFLKLSILVTTPLPLVRLWYDRRVV